MNDNLETESFKSLLLKMKLIKELCKDDEELYLRTMIKAINDNPIESNVESNVESNIEQQIEIKKGRGRPKRYDEGCKQHNKDVKYFLNYYYENKNKTITCSLCGKENVKKLRLALHKKSKCCINAQIKNELEELKKQNTLIN